MGKGTQDVALSLYDISPMNAITYHLGWGKFHSGIVVHGTEYIYSHEGIFEVTPESAAEKSDGKYRFRTSIMLGKTDLDRDQLKDYLTSLQPHFSESLYDPVANNSNHFSNTLSRRLCGKAIPQFVNLVSDLTAFSFFYPILKVIKPKS